jgi:hypothetical protein
MSETNSVERPVRPIAYAVPGHLISLSRCNGRSVWCENPGIHEEPSVTANELVALYGQAELEAAVTKERNRWAASVALARQCIDAAYNDQWASFDALSDDFDDAVSAANAGPNTNSGTDPVA